MSIMSIPKSYAVLMGIEGYSRGVKNMERIKKALGIVKGDDDGSGDEEKEEERRRQRKITAGKTDTLKAESLVERERGSGTQANGVTV